MSEVIRCPSGAETGGSLLEYTLLLTLVLGGVVLSVMALSGSVSGSFSHAAARMKANGKLGSGLSAGNQIVSNSGTNPALPPKSPAAFGGTLNVGQLITWLKSGEEFMAFATRHRYPDFLRWKEDTDNSRAAKLWWFPFGMGQVAPRPSGSGNGADITRAQEKSGVDGPVLKP